MTTTVVNTRTQTRTVTNTRTITASRTPTVTPVPPNTRTPTFTRPPTNTRTPSFTLTPSRTKTVTRTPTATIPRPFGPEVTFFGVATADNHVREPIGQTDDGVPIFDWPNNFGFLFVVEGRPGTSNRQLADCGAMGQVQCADIGLSLSAVQVIANRTLGNGSAAVCDVGPPPDFPIGGVPLVASFTFDGSPSTNNAILDFACRFDVHKTSDTACTFDALDNYSFIHQFPGTKQYCSVPAVGGEIALPSGITRFKVRIEDAAGNIGNEAQIAVSVP